jgi:membrane-bound serine protease (ClpP class)
MVAGLIAPCAPAADVPARTPAVGLDLTGPIGPATSDYVARGLARAAAEGAPLAIVRLDTPGGLETSMREIVQAILAARMPVVGFVGPAGAHAASAGTFILYACHVAAMAPATNLGAATPVAVPTPGLPGAGGGDKQDDGPAGTPPDLRDKAISDAVAFIRSLAQLRGRNAEWAELAVTRAASLSADDALREGVIDLIAADVADLMARLDGRTVALDGGSVRLETAGLAVSVIEPDWRSRLLAAITDPTVAAILMLIGVYGLIFEFYSPGLVGPGVIGAICLLLALYAFHVLPVNESALALMVLGLALTVAEAVTPGFGVLGLGGLVAFVLGAVMLVDRDIPGFAVAWQAVGGAALMVGGLGLAALWLAMRARRRPVVSGREEMTGQAGTVVRWEGRSGVVHVHGERWAARAARPLQPGEQVRVAAIDGLTLEVEPQPQQQPDEQPARQKERRSAKDDQTEERREP